MSYEESFAALLWMKQENNAQTMLYWQTARISSMREPSGNAEVLWFCGRRINSTLQ